MEIISLKLKNFKGIKDLFIEFNGKNTNIYGDNATGKTTIADAFNWLLFDKDTQGKKDFGIKTLDSNNNPIHFLEHEVEAVIMTDKVITLRKVFEEKWTKKRGSAEKEFEGHTTSYFIDGVPKPLKDYNAFINTILDEDKFKLLTSPSYFNEQLQPSPGKPAWQKRRDILFEVCKDAAHVTDDDVISSDKSLLKLNELLNGRSVDDCRKVIKSSMGKLNDQIEKIPTRIDEVTLGLPDITGLDENYLTSQIEAKKTLLKEKQQELLQIESGGEIAQKKNKLNEIRSEILVLENEQRSKLNDVLSEKRNAVSETTSKGNAIKSEIAMKELEVSTNQEKIQALNDKADTLRANWRTIDSKVFEMNQETICPTCGQNLPEEKLADARAKAEAEFNRSKAEKLTAITAEGKQIVVEVKVLEESNKQLTLKIDELTKTVAGIWKEVTKLQGEYDALKNTPQNITSEYAEKTTQRDLIEAEIANLQSGNSDGISKAKEAIAGIETEIKELQNQLVTIERNKAGHVRIDELTQLQKEYAAEYEKLEGELYLTEQFIRTKVAMLEGKINSKFKFARFKLFETQINGGVNECCETLYNGVPYGSGLNNAARINVGLDIINTLSQYYGFTAPIFIDNRESVTKLTEVNAQVISLIVSEADKKLRVEIAQEIKEVA